MPSKQFYYDIDLVKNSLLNAKMHPLSTADRITFGDTLTVDDKGILSYDTDQSMLFSWNGTQWVIPVIPSIFNQNVSAQTANFWISGQGKIGTSPTDPLHIIRLQDLPTALPPSGSARGDLTGAYPNPGINQINGITKDYYDPTSSIQTQLNGKQLQLNGTGFIKASGTTISYDNSSYLSTAGGTLSGDVQQTFAPVNGNSLITKGYVSNSYVPYTGAISDLDLASTGKGLYAEFSEIGHGAGTGAGLSAGLFYNNDPTGVGIEIQAGDATYEALYVQPYNLGAKTIQLFGDGHAIFAGPITGNLFGNASTVTNGVYTTGSYSDPAWILNLAYSKLTGAPSTLPPSGSAGGDLSGTYPNPTINTINGITKSYYDPTSSIQTQLNSKQNTLISGTDIKTINSGSLLGSGNILLQTPLVAGTDYLIPTGNGSGLTGITYSQLTGTVPTWNQSTTGNAATVTNGVYTTSFNTLGDVRYLPFTAGSSKPLTDNLFIYKTNNAVYTEYQDTSSLVAITVGKVGNPEANLTYNMHYDYNVTLPGGNHQYGYDSTQSAQWFAFSGDFGAMQHAPANLDTSQDIWSQSGGRYLWCWDAAGRFKINSDVSSGQLGDAQLQIKRNTGVADLSGITDLYIEGNRNSGVAGEVYINHLSAADVYITNGVGNTLTGPIIATANSTTGRGLSILGRASDNAGTLSFYDHVGTSVQGQFISESGALYTTLSGASITKVINTGFEVTGTVTASGTISATNLSGTNTGDETTTRINALYGYTPANGADYLSLLGGTIIGSVYFDSGVTFNTSVALKNYTVATLPAAPGVGSIATVTDASSPTYGATVVGGGSVLALVMYDGAWKVH